MYSLCKKVLIRVGSAPDDDGRACEDRSAVRRRQEQGRQALAGRISNTASVLSTATRTAHSTSTQMRRLHETQLHHPHALHHRAARTAGGLRGGPSQCAAHPRRRSWRPRLRMLRQQLLRDADHRPPRFAGRAASTGLRLDQVRTSTRTTGKQPPRTLDRTRRCWHGTPCRQEPSRSLR